MSQMSQKPLGNTIKRLRSRAWVLTINNYVESDVSKIKNYFDKWIIGREHELPVINGSRVCLNVTPHLQVFGKCHLQKDFGSIKKEFPRAHIEMVKGSEYSNMKYCSKEGYYETNMELDHDGNIIETLYLDLLKEM